MITRYYFKDNRLCSDNHAPKYLHECDVLVIGAGTAGSIAAIAAARLGYRVICADKQKAPGGMGTFACVYDYYYGGSCDIAEQINEKATADDRFCATLVYDDEKSVNGSAKMLGIIDEFMSEGVGFAPDCRVYAVYSDGGRIDGICFISADGLCDIKARAVIDTTGAVAKLCGCKTNGNQNRMKASKCCAVMRDGTLRGEWSNIGVLSGERYERSRQLLEAAANPPLLHDETAGLIRFVGSEIGERESENIGAKTVASGYDLLQKRNDAAFVGIAPFDNAGCDIALETPFLQNWQIAAGLSCYGVSYAVPKTAMLVNEADNLILAGKIIGLDHSAASAVRMKGDMEQCGKAAAEIADEMLDNKQGFSPIEFDGAALYSMIKQDGVLVETVLPQTQAEFIENICSDYPEAAYFAVLKGGESGEFCKYAQNLLNSDNELLRERCAIACAMFGIAAAKPILQQIIEGGRKVIARPRANYHFGWYNGSNLCDYDKAKALLARY
ncbi:MAG: FAD-dependent oxidoreductase [Acutalibacteraceae bacterium]